mmetsp:Transcript_5859/g.17004  ORF Transcript_5859/g.17004 Transcript_5859/m.17004 type:complete len:143 (+) Transcript_5859:480-908(+)
MEADLQQLEPLPAFAELSNAGHQYLDDSQRRVARVQGLVPGPAAELVAAEVSAQVVAPPFWMPSLQNLSLWVCLLRDLPELEGLVPVRGVLELARGACALPWQQNSFLWGVRQEAFGPLVAAVELVVVVAAAGRPALELVSP